MALMAGSRGSVCHNMGVYLHRASLTLLKNSRYTQPYGACLRYKVCVQVQPEGASDCTHGVERCMKCFVWFAATQGTPCNAGMIEQPHAQGDHFNSLQEKSRRGGGKSEGFSRAPARVH